VREEKFKEHALRDLITVYEHKNVQEDYKENKRKVLA